VLGKNFLSVGRALHNNCHRQLFPRTKLYLSLVSAIFYSLGNLVKLWQVHRRLAREKGTPAIHLAVKSDKKLSGVNINNILKCVFVFEIIQRCSVVNNTHQVVEDMSSVTRVYIHRLAFVRPTPSPPPERYTRWRWDLAYYYTLVGLSFVYHRYSWAVPPCLQCRDVGIQVCPL